MWRKVLCKDTLVFLLITISLTGLVLGGCGLQVKQSVPDHDEIQRRVSAVLELPTYEYIYRDIVYIADQASFLGIRHRDTQLLFSVDVRLQAGIDLQRGFSVHPRSSRIIEIHLPEPEILLIDADEATIHQYFKREFGGEINRLAYYDEISHSKEKIRNDALSRGVLDRAKENAISLIESALRQAGFSGIEIHFDRGDSGEDTR